MEIVIKIPKEFEEHFKSDRFEDSLSRVASDIESFGFQLSGRYEKETITMLREAIKNGTPLPKIVDSLKELSKDHRHNFVGNSCEERAWRLGIEDSIDLILAESEVNADADGD